MKRAISIYRVRARLHAPRYALHLRTRASWLSTKEIRFTARHRFARSSRPRTRLFCPPVKLPECHGFASTEATTDSIRSTSLSLSSSHVIKPLTRACSRFSKLKQERGEWLPFQESLEIWEKLNSCDVQSHFILLPLLFSRNFFRRYRRTRSAFVCTFSLNRLKCTRISKS